MLLDDGGSGGLEVRPLEVLGGNSIEFKITQKLAQRIAQESN